MEFSRGAGQVAPFLAMEIFERAGRLRREGRDVLELCVGEPRFHAPPGVVEAAVAALTAGKTHYTDSRGVIELREEIVRDCARRRGRDVDPAHVVVTSGTSQAMVLVFHLLLDPGDEVLIPTPHYPCYPNIVAACGGVPVLVPTSSADGYAVDPSEARRRITRRTKAIVVASPANPTGAVQPADAVRGLAELGVPVISDEIYDGLVYGDVSVTSPLAHTEDCFVLDGFSKRYAMTGFRLGYLIAPPSAARALQSLQQNLFISAGDFVQHAGVAALRAGPEYLAGVTRELATKRDVLTRGLAAIGLGVPSAPAGAFYAFVDARRYGSDSMALALRLLEEASVAIAPGRDFGEIAEGWLRFSFCADDAVIEAAVVRLARVLGAART